ncbi:MAG: deoxyribonuclease IV [Erysipelotrichaceae bacterium]|nr:deoxyribonuclease IV [Erysipelotrichaceae bacterium]
MLKIGSHVGMSGKEMMLGSVKEALSYNANTFMFYTGAPQNTRRKKVEELNVEAAKQLMLENNIDINDVVVHAPYIINLGNTIKPETFELAVDFLKQEIERVEYIGVKILVLHPGSHVKAGEQLGLNQIVEGLNAVLTPEMNVRIALETMAGKGSELGRNFEELRYIFDHVTYPEKLGVCLDTCHLHDSGYDLTHFDELLEEFDKVIGIDKILVMHINDSKNERGAKKDRHENLGYGYIGFETLCNIVHHPKLENIPKILETPYVDKMPPYQKEIEMLRNKKFEEGLK